MKRLQKSFLQKGETLTTNIEIPFSDWGFVKKHINQDLKVLMEDLLMDE